MASFNLTSFVSVFAFSYPFMSATLSGSPRMSGIFAAKFSIIGVVKPTHPWGENVPSREGDFPPWIRFGKPIGILMGPNGFNLLPASTVFPGANLPLTQGSSGGVHVGLKRRDFACRRPVGRGNSGYPMPTL